MIQTNETENNSSSPNEDETVVRTGPVRREQIDENSIIGKILYQGNIRIPMTVTKYINSSGRVWVKHANGNESRLEIETLFWNKIDVTEAQADVITEQIDDNSIIGTILYQGDFKIRPNKDNIMSRIPMTVTRYFNGSDNVWVQDNSGNEPIKVPIETLFLSNDLESSRCTKPER